MGEFTTRLGNMVLDAFEAFGTALRQVILFVLGLSGVIAVASLSLSGEIIDDLTTYHSQPIDWMHVSKVMFPPVALAIVSYLKHTQLVQEALETTPPGLVEEKSVAKPAGA